MKINKGRKDGLNIEIRINNGALLKNNPLLSLVLTMGNLEAPRLGLRPHSGSDLGRCLLFID